MLPKKIFFKKKLWSNFKSGKLKVSCPERFETPKERPDITPEESAKALMDIWVKIIEQSLRESGNRTGKKRNRLIRKIKWIQGGK